jgi:hypothetical protein
MNLEREVVSHSSMPSRCGPAPSRAPAVSWRMSNVDHGSRTTRHPQSPVDFEVMLLSSQCDLENVYALRARAWRARIELMEATWKEPLDSVASHWGIKHEGRLIAACRLSIHSRMSEVPDAEVYKDFICAAPIASFNRCVVAPEFVGLGLAGAMDRARLNEAVRCRCKSVLVAVDLPSRIRSLQRLGFRVIRDGGVHKSGPLAGIPTMICLFTIS